MSKFGMIASPKFAKTENKSKFAASKSKNFISKGISTRKY